MTTKNDHPPKTGTDPSAKPEWKKRADEFAEAFVKNLNANVTAEEEARRAKENPAE